MVNNEQLQAAAAHIFDTFDDALDRLGKNPENAIELLHLVAKHAATRVELDGRSANDAEMTWATTARKFMEQNKEVDIVLTLLVDRSGVVTPLAAAKDTPAILVETLRSVATNVVVAACTSVLKRSFRCGCPTCRNGGAQELRDAISAGRAGWSQTKAEA